MATIHLAQVVEGTAEIDQPTIAYVFTGQGSQEQGMGMALYDSSPVAKDIWQRADRHFLENYGMYLASLFVVIFVPFRYAVTDRFCSF